MKQKSHLFKVFGFEINFNGMLTAVAASGTWALLSWLIHTIQIDTGYIKSIPAIQKDIITIKAEQVRMAKEYLPPIHPTPTPIS